jgi:hypothetical protein
MEYGMKKFTINDQYKKMIPESFEELTFKQYYDLQEMNKINPLKMANIIAYLLGTTTEQVLKSINAVDYSEILNCISWFKAVKEDEIKKPEMIDIIYDGKESHFIPKNMDYYMASQFEDAKICISKTQKEDLAIKYYPEIVSCFIDQVIFGEHNKENHEKTIPIVENLPVLEVIGLGNFFVMKCVDLLRGTMKDVNHRLTIPKKLKQAFKDLKCGVS